ncbi:TniQ family protein [Kitasatospora hibisci]|uniref:TniQ family protein n=1 Tax=Kitasatospora hibisci TaxID=3369522 RepID=UPI003754147C
MPPPTARLPRSLIPLPGESLPGFLLRLGHRLDSPPGLMLWRCGLAGANPTAHQAAASYLFLLDASKRERFAQVTGTSAEIADQLTLRPLIDRYPPIAHALISPKDPNRAPRGRRVFPPWVLSSHSRYCPACLAGDGSPIQQRHGGPWLLRWRLATSFACLKHNILLEHRCPDCRVPVGFDSTGDEFARVGLVAWPGLSGLHPACCRSHRRSLGDCGRRLDEPGSLPSIALTPELARLQERLDHLLTPQVEPARAFEAFADLQVATSIVLATWPVSAPAMAPSHAAAVEEHLADQDARMAGSVPHRILWDRGLTWSFLPRSTLGTAAVLSAADRLLQLPAAELLSELRRITGQIPDRDFKRWGKTWRILSNDASVGFRAQVTEAIPSLFPVRPRRILPADVWSRARVIPSFLPVQLDQQHGYRPEQIPQELPEHWVRIFRDDPSLSVTSAIRRLRRTLAIQLVQAASGLDAQQAVDYLGLPPGTDLLKTEDTPTIKQDTRADAAELRKGLARLAEHLASLPPDHRADYRLRRQHFAAWHLGREAFEELRDLFVTANGRQPPVPSARLHDALSALIWRRVTGSEYCLAPCFRPPFSPAGRRADSMTAEVRLARLIEQARPKSPYRVLLPALEQYARDMVMSFEQSNPPLSAITTTPITATTLQSQATQP